MPIVDSLVPGLGNWVDGPRFFNRETELKMFINHLSRGESISLIAQRRIGKTSLMREAARQLGDSAISLHIDFEKSRSPEDAIIELSLGLRPHASLWRRGLDIVLGAAKGATDRLESLSLSEISISLRSGVNKDDWRQKGDAIFAALAQVAEQQNKKVVVFLDEVPILVSRILRDKQGMVTPEGREQTDLLMSWLRDNAIRHKDRIALVVTGSIGLEPLLSQAGLSGTLNAYRSFEIRPWSTQTATKCLQALATNQDIPLPEVSATRMVELLGSAIPHHVQMFFDHVYTAYLMEEQEGDVSIDFIERVYSDSMTGLRGHAELAHMEERLRLVLSESSFLIALELLTESAVVGSFSADTALSICSDIDKTANSRRLMNDIIAMLVHDGYIVQHENRFSFSSKLLGDWWRRRFGQGYKIRGADL
jgi:hypothetical protein